MNNVSIYELLQGYYNNTLTEQEQHELIERLQKENHDEVLLKAIEQAFENDQLRSAVEMDRRDLIFETLMHRIRQEDNVTNIKAGKRTVFMGAFSMWRVAAAVVLLVTTAVFYFLVDKNAGKEGSENLAAYAPHDVQPGRNKAMLTLANGKSITLDDAAEGLLSNEGGTAVTKSGNGSLSYDGNGVGSKDVLFNVIETPRGGQYKVTLSDGTKVWLNAASSLRFPTAFTGKERNVILTGEAYFEVAKNALKPFKVTLNGMEVKVLGTHFNVNAYPDESSVNTTLLEGSVMITQNKNKLVIKPGQQALVEDKIKVKDNVDLEAVTAWKNERFTFSNASLETVMRQIARWYDVSVVFDHEIKDTYSVDISRNVPLSELLHYIEMSGGVHFEFNNQKIMVHKKN